MAKSSEMKGSTISRAILRIETIAFMVTDWIWKPKEKEEISKLLEVLSLELTDGGSIKNSHEKIIILSLLLVMLSTKWYPDGNNSCEVQHISYLGA